MGFFNTFFNYRTNVHTRATSRNTRQLVRTSRQQLAESKAHTDLFQQQVAQATATTQREHEFRYATDEKYREWCDQWWAEQRRQDAERLAYAAQLRARNQAQQARIVLWVCWVLVPYVMIFIPANELPITANWWSALDRSRRVAISAGWAVFVVLVGVVGGLTGN